ncbi:MAG: hypothetical protein V4577_13690 [Bacteroidota bacterium]
MQTELYELNTDNDRIQFIGHIVIKITDDITDHIKICPHPSTCQAEPNAQEILYFLYGKLSEYGVEVHTEDFTIDDIRNSNVAIGQIINKLEEIKVGEHILYDDQQEVIEKLNELQNDLTALKGMYVVGKKKWYQLVIGAVLSKLGDKSMEVIWEPIKPYLSHIVPFFKTFLLLNDK